MAATTLTAGSIYTYLVNSSGRMTLTPGGGGTITILSRDSSDDTAVPRSISAAETLPLRASSTISFQAVGVDATWEFFPFDSAENMAFLQSSVSGGALVKKSPTVSWVPGARRDATYITGSQRTYNMMATAPADFDAVQIIMFADDTVSATLTGCVAVSESNASKRIPLIGGTPYNALAAANTQLGWVPVTWASSSSLATSTTGVQTRPAIHVSDWIPLSSIPRTDSGTKPLIMVRMAHASTTAAIPVNSFASAADVTAYRAEIAPHEFYVNQSAVDGVAVPSAFTVDWAEGSDYLIIPVRGLRFRCRGAYSTVMFAGDSLTRGSGADSWWKGWAHKAGRAVGAGYINAGLPGQTQATYNTFAGDLITALNPTAVVEEVLSPNDTDGGSYVAQTLSKQMSAAMGFVQTVLQTGAVPVLWDGVPFGTASGAGQYVLAGAARVASVGIIDKFNVTVQMSNPAATGGTNIYGAAYDSGDHVHPNQAGHDLIYAAAMTALNKHK